MVRRLPETLAEEGAGVSRIGVRDGGEVDRMGKRLFASAAEKALERASPVVFQSRGSQEAMK